MADLPINYGDTGKVARDKINDSFNSVVATVEGYRPHIENGIRWIGNTNTGVKALGDSISMKVESGYIRYKSESQTNWTQIVAIADLKGDKGDQGEKGDQGDPGETGADGNGIASITSSKSGKITTVTITETNGDSESFEISDGADGGGGSGDGDVKGPNSATDGHLAVFDGATGKLIKDGGSVPSYSASDFDIKDLTDSTSLRTTWSGKQDTIVAGTNIQIANDGKTISATDTTYSATDFDIKDLADSTSLRSTWSGKQDAISDLNTIRSGASAGATAVQPGDIGTAAACNTGTSSGNVPILDSNGKLATSTLPGVALTDTFTVSTSSDLTSLSSADQGDIAIVTTENKTYVLSQAPYSTAANWKEILAPTGGVTSVNGNTGAVTVSEFTASNGGTKVFTYPTTSVEDIVTWCNGGGTAILMKSDGPYVVSKVGTGYITSVRDISGDGGTFGTGSVRVDMLTYNNTYALTSSNNVVTYNHIRYSNLTVTLTSAGWSSNTQTVSATGVTASNTVFISPSPSNYSDYTDAEIYCSAQGSGTLTFTCGTEPTSNITVNVFLIR